MRQQQQIPDISASNILGNKQQLFSEDDIRRMSEASTIAETNQFTNAQSEPTVVPSDVFTPQDEPDEIVVPSRPPPPQPTPAAQGPPSPQQPPSPNPPTKTQYLPPKKHTVIIISLVVVLAVVIAVSGFLLYRCKSKKNSGGMSGGDMSALQDVLHNGGRSAIYSEFSA